MPNHSEVVRNQEERKPHLISKPLEKPDDLGLDTDIERRDRFIEDEQFRMQRKRASDADALSLTTGELMREPVEVIRSQLHLSGEFVHSFRNAAPIITADQ